MSEVQFDEEYRPAARNSMQSGKARADSMLEKLQKIGLAKTEKQAYYILLIFSIVSLLLAATIVYFFVIGGKLPSRTKLPYVPDGVAPAALRFRHGTSTTPSHS